MIARFGRRLLEAAVALFALLGFAFVPLGEHTGLEHLRAIVSTPAAERAARELVQAGTRLRQRLVQALITGRKPDGSAGRTPELPEPDLRPEPENARIVPSVAEIDASAPYSSGS